MKLTKKELSLTEIFNHREDGEDFTVEVKTVGSNNPKVFRNHFYTTTIFVDNRVAYKIQGKIPQTRISEPNRDLDAFKMHQEAVRLVNEELKIKSIFNLL